MFLAREITTSAGKTKKPPTNRPFSTPEMSVSCQESFLHKPSVFSCFSSKKKWWKCMSEGWPRNHKIHQDPFQHASGSWGESISIVCLLFLPRSALSIEVKAFVCCELWPCWKNYKLSRVKNCQIPCERQRFPHSSGSALKSLCQFSQCSPAPPLPVCFCYNLAGPRNSVEQCGLV